MQSANENRELLQKQQQLLINATEIALQYAKKKGASAEVGVTKSGGLSLSTRLQEIENIEFNNDGALGISVYLGNRKGNASTSDLSKSAIEKTVSAAIAIAEHTSPDDCAGLAPKELLAFNPSDLELYHPTDIDVDKMIELCLEMESSAMANKNIFTSDGANFNATTGVRVYGNTEGMLESYLSSRYSLSCGVIAGEQNNLEQDYEYSVSRQFEQLATPQWVGKNAALKAVKKLNPQKINSQTAPVIFMNDVATGLIGHLVGAISGGSLYRKASFLLNSLGTHILPEWFMIEECPHILKALASTPFDSEGVRTQSRDIVLDGVLQTYLLTQYSAKKLGLTTTGHAGGIHNWLVKPNYCGGLETLLNQMDTGLLVTDLMGQGVNGVTGDYSRGASGFWVEKGEIKYPVAEITIAGNLKEMYQQIISVSDDVETRSNIQTGSILVEQMKISGI